MLQKQIKCVLVIIAVFAIAGCVLVIIAVFAIAGNDDENHAKVTIALSSTEKLDKGSIFFAGPDIPQNPQDHVAFSQDRQGIAYSAPGESLLGIVGEDLLWSEFSLTAELSYVRSWAIIGIAGLEHFHPQVDTTFGPESHGIIYQGYRVKANKGNNMLAFVCGRDELLTLPLQAPVTIKITRSIDGVLSVFTGGKLIFTFPSVLKGPARFFCLLQALGKVADKNKPASIRILNVSRKAVVVLPKKRAMLPTGK